MKLLNWTVVGRLGHELATINCPHVVSGAGDCDRAMGPCVGRRANFECILIDGGASPARGCGQAGAGRWAACGRDQGTRKAGLSSQISPNRDAHSVMTLALEPAAPLVRSSGGLDSNPSKKRTGLLGPGRSISSGPFHLGRRLYDFPGLIVVEVCWQRHRRTKSGGRGVPPETNRPPSR